MKGRAGQSRPSWLSLLETRGRRAARAERRRGARQSVGRASCLVCQAGMWPSTVSGCCRQAWLAAAIRRHQSPPLFFSTRRRSSLAPASEFAGWADRSCGWLYQQASPRSLLTSAMRTGPILSRSAMSRLPGPTCLSGPQGRGLSYHAHMQIYSSCTFPVPSPYFLLTFVMILVPVTSARPSTIQSNEQSQHIKLPPCPSSLSYRLVAPPPYPPVGLPGGESAVTVDTWGR
jgi:hypothetical protein